MATKNRGGLLGVAALAIILILVAQQGGLFTQQTATQSTAPFQPVSQEASFYTGRVAMQVAHYNALAITTSLTEGTNVDTTWWVRRGGQYLYTGTSGDAATFDLTEVDGGYVYAQVETKSGQSYYFAKDVTLQREKTRIKGYQYFDIDEDGVEEHVLQVYCGDIKPVAGGQTSQDCYVNFAWYAYEVPTMTDVSDVSSIGTTAGTVKYIEFYTTQSNTNKAWLLSEIELKFNSTSTTKWTIEWVEIPGLGKIPGSSFDKTTDGTNTMYNYKISAKLNEAHPITYGQNELNRKDFTVKMKWSLSSGDVIKLTQTLYVLKVDESQTSVSDSVANSA